MGKAEASAFRALLHVDAVNALSVGRIGVADGQFPRVILGLRHAFGQFFVPCLGLDDGQLGVAIHEHVIGGECLATSPVAFDATGVMGYSRRIRLPSTTPQPAALRAGSMCSALVSASFIECGLEV